MVVNLTKYCKKCYKLFAHQAVIWSEHSVSRSTQHYMLYLKIFNTNHHTIIIPFLQAYLQSGLPIHGIVKANLNMSEQPQGRLS